MMRLTPLDEDTEYEASGEKGWLYVLVGPDRGYSDIEQKLYRLGAKIRREK